MEREDRSAQQNGRRVTTLEPQWRSPREKNGREKRQTDQEAQREDLDRPNLRDQILVAMKVQPQMMTAARRRMRGRMPNLTAPSAPKE